MSDIDYKANKKTYNQAIRLSGPAQENPYLYICAFFDAQSLSDVRRLLFKWYAAAITSENSASNYPVGQSDLLFLYQSMESLVEAAFLLNEKKCNK